MQKTCFKTSLLASVIDTKIAKIAINFLMHFFKVQGSLLRFCPFYYGYNKSTSLDLCKDLTN